MRSELLRLKFILMAIAGLLLLVLLPVLTNQIMRWDWFSKIVVGEEESWISFYGSYLGGIIGGLLTLIGVIITIKYQDRLKQKSVEESHEKGIKIIDNLVDRAFGNLFTFLPAFTDDYVLDYGFIQFMRNDLIKLKKTNIEMHQLSWEVIPPQYFKEFTHIRELVDILDVEISSVFNTDNLTNIDIQKRLEKIDTVGKIQMILTQYIKFAENKELMTGVLEEIKEKYLNKKKGGK